MDNIKIHSLGPIKDAAITFGDLTLFVGPQASGKSILLQLVKLLEDKNHTQKTLEQYGYVFENRANKILDRFFGEGMSELWTDSTSVSFNGKTVSKDSFINKRGRPNKGENEKETLFYIPAQRVVCLQNGWPRFFTDYDDAVPYVLRQFSETLRQLLENGTIERNNDVVFPQSQRLKEPLRDSFNNSIFHDGKVILDKADKKRFKLNVGNTSLPFMVWSAGQKEFMPLLLSFYWLCPASKTSKRNDINYVVIEEPEMGLHPQAIKSVILQIIDLVARGYKVIVSTHSPVLLEFVWAYNFLKKHKTKSDVLFELFELPKDPALTKIFNTLLKEKQLNTYYFDRSQNEVTVKDISTLDAADDDLAVSEWGGLSSFSSRASDIISKIVANEEE
jgi:predicted ATPase